MTLPRIFLMISLSILFIVRNVSGNSRRGNQNKHFELSKVFFFLFEIRAVYEITWKTTVERGMPQMTTWRARALHAGNLRLQLTEIIQY